MTTINIQVAPRVGPANPRGAQVIAWLFLAVGRGLHALFSRRAPVAEPARNPAQEAQAVRELARQHQFADPRFAADLYAAADRHERLHGAG